MANATATSEKPIDSPSSKDIARTGGALGDLLKASDLGVRVTGIVLGFDEPKAFSGTSAKGKAYSFAQMRAQLWTGNKAVPVVFRKDKVEEFGALPVGHTVTLRVVGASVNNGQVTFDVEG